MQRDEDERERQLTELQEAVALWLAWNEQYSRLLSAMLEHSDDQRRMEQLADQLDQLRFRAVELSRQALRAADEHRAE